MASRNALKQTDNTRTRVEVRVKVGYVGPRNGKRAPRATPPQPGLVRKDQRIRIKEPAMFTPLPTPSEMARWDRAAVDLGLPELLLMENASREALHVLRQLRGPLTGQRVLLFMGGGNNGGDAACLARHLLDAGAAPLVLHTRPLAAYRGVTARHLALARRCGVPFGLAAGWPGRYHATPWSQPDIVVDGLLGTGFAGGLRPPLLDLVRHINTLGERAFVLALDVPSGLSGLSGRPCPEAVRARATVTFEAAKPGLVLPEAAPYVGKLHVRPIGIPALVRREMAASYQLITRRIVQALPVPEAGWHKGRAGHVAIVGGSPGLTGAPHLAALGALRSGAGLVTVAAPEGLAADIKGNAPDVMLRPLAGPGNGQGWLPAMAEGLAAFTAQSSALVLGPGLGREPDTTAFVAAILSLPQRPPTVVDADALRALRIRPEALRALRPEDVLTPHPGEAADLLGLSPADIQADRFAALAKLMELAPCVWLLKGAGTLVGRAGEPVSVLPLAVPQLAVGGSGDVLAGCLGALMGQRVPAFVAACAAARLHAEAGLLLAGRFPQRGNTASDIAAALPEARTRLAAPAKQ